MTVDRDTTRVVRSWLRTEEHESADRVLQAVLSSLDTTPQRRPSWPSRRFAQMSLMTRMSVAAAAVLIVALAAFSLLPRNPGYGGQPSPSPTSTIPSPSPTFPPLAGQTALGGRFTVGSGLRSHVTVEVPASWSASGDWVVRGPRGNGPPDGVALRFYSVSNVFKNPLSLDAGILASVGPTAADLAAAIVGDAAWHATGPTAVSSGGRPALRVTFNVAELGKDGRFDMFGTTGNPEIWGFANGQLFDLYIVDVEGERVVIDSLHYAGTSARDLAAQQAVIDSIRLDP